MLGCIYAWLHLRQPKLRLACSIFDSSNAKPRFKLASGSFLAAERCQLSCPCAPLSVQLSAGPEGTSRRLHSCLHNTDNCTLDGPSIRCLRGPGSPVSNGNCACAVAHTIRPIGGSRGCCPFWRTENAADFLSELRLALEFRFCKVSLAQRHSASALSAQGVLPCPAWLDQMLQPWLIDDLCPSPPSGCLQVPRDPGLH